MRFKVSMKIKDYEYEEITDLIYNAYMGCDIGYADDDCLALLADAKDAKRKIRAEQKQKLKIINCK